MATTGHEGEVVRVSGLKAALQKLKTDLIDGKATSLDLTSHTGNTNNPHSVTKSQVGLGSVVNTGDSATPVSGGTTKFTTGGAYTELAKKVDKVTGKGLSTNDYTDAEKTKLSGIQTGATKVESSTTNGKIKINGTDTTVYTHPSATAVSAAAKKVGMDALGHVVLGDALAASDVGLGNVTNHAQVKRTEMGSANGVATLDADGKVPSSQLPAYVDDVIDLIAIATSAPSTCAKGDKYYNSSSGNLKIYTATAANTWGSTGATPEKDKIYVNTADSKTYRWSGSSMAEISASLALGETSSTAYRGDRGKTAYDHSQSTHARTDATKVEASSTNGNIKINGTETTVYTHPTGTNPHGTTKSDVGLGNVTNNAQVKGLASGTTENHVLIFGADGYTVKDSGFTIGKSVPSDAAFTDTNTKVTSVVNHYAPSADDNAELTAAISGTAGAYAKDTEYTVLTGVKAQRDAKGHVTGLTYTAQKIKDTNTTYSSKTAASGGTDTSLCTTGEKYTWNNKQDALTFASDSICEDIVTELT